MRAGLSASVALRWSRATVLAFVAMLTGTTAHLVAGGPAPEGGVLVGLTCVVALAAARVLGRPASTPRLVCLLAAGQAFIHVGLGLLASPHTAPHGMASMHHHAAATTAPDLLMVGAHLVAAVTVGLWLAAGERATWTLILLASRPVAETVAAIRLVVLAAGAIRLTPTYPGTVPVLAEGWRPAPTQRCRPVTRRGPPARVLP